MSGRLALSLALLGLASGGRPSASKESISMRLLKDGKLVLEHDEAPHGRQHRGVPRLGAQEGVPAALAEPAAAAPASAPERGVAILERAAAPEVPGQDSFLEYLHESLSPTALDEVLRIATQLQAKQATSLAETGMAGQVLTTKPDPNMPTQNIQSKPKGFSENLWGLYQKAFSILKPLRGGHLNVVATFAAMGLGPENCILKLAYILTSMKTRTTTRTSLRLAALTSPSVWVALRHN
ncbi:unnamed protein product [Prorocentrum cordatum]|uniref:Uncharacterized protein n=1 Tax=Prorocentrum cordatum TaxID=2364126 RepID=A0ABN9QCH3_9DINO|nr:unnamed protein product [Polarella glacialis]